MNKTQLNLYFFDSPDLKTIYLQDTSIYNPDLPIENPTIEILQPNFTNSYVVIYPTLSLIPINSNVLGYTPTQNFEDLKCLSDGLWLFTQSVKPNGLIKRSYNHFRITNLKTELINYISDKIDSDTVYINKNDLWYHQMFVLLQTLESAKFLAENCGKCEEAKIMYNQVQIQATQLFGDC